MVRKARGMRKGRRERIEKWSRERIEKEKRERDNRELRRQLEKDIITAIQLLQGTELFLQQINIIIRIL